MYRPCRGATPVDTHEWVSFEDEDEERTWVFDVTFPDQQLEVHLRRRVPGCAHRPRTRAGAGMLQLRSPPDRQEGRPARREGRQDPHGRRVGEPRHQEDGDPHQQARRTGDPPAGGRLHLSQQPRFRRRPRLCAPLGRASRGVNPLTYKPEVCWQLPLRREDQVEDDGHVVSTIRQWDRRHWGKGGEEFHWWCTQDPEAFVGTKPVYEEMEAELTEMVGATRVPTPRGLSPAAGPPAGPARRAPHPAVRYPKPVAASGFSTVEEQFENGQASEVKATHTPSPEGAILLPE